VAIVHYSSSSSSSSSSSKEVGLSATAVIPTDIEFYQLLFLNDGDNSDDDDDDANCSNWNNIGQNWHLEAGVHVTTARRPGRIYVCSEERYWYCWGHNHSFTWVLVVTVMWLRWQYNETDILLPQRNHVTCYITWNLVNCCTTVQTTARLIIFQNP